MTIKLDKLVFFDEDVYFESRRERHLVFKMDEYLIFLNSGLRKVYQENDKSPIELDFLEEFM